MEDKEKLKRDKVLLENERVRYQMWSTKRMHESFKDLVEGIFYSDEDLTECDCAMLMCTFGIKPHHVYLLAASHGKKMPEDEAIKEYINWHQRIDIKNTNEKQDDRIQPIHWNQKLDEKIQKGGKDEKVKPNDPIDSVRGYAS